MNSHQLFQRSRFRLAFWYALVMGSIFSVFGWGIYQALIQSNWSAIEREMEAIAGTLHDSLEPMLPTSGNPAPLMRQIFPELCVPSEPCSMPESLLERHTTGISDRNTYYLRLFNDQGVLLAFSPNSPAELPRQLQKETWQTIATQKGDRYHQFSIILHSVIPASAGNPDFSWGYLQVGRNLASLDAEIQRLRWILGLSIPIVLGLVGISAWGLSGLAMKPIYLAYQQQQQFTANAAHELRSPLASLLATIEAILRIRPNPQELDSMLITVERQGRRLSHVISDLLLLASLEQQKHQPPFQPCGLNDLVEDLVEEFAELASAANVQLVSKVCDQSTVLLGYESQLYRLVSNLITNAIQYTPEHGSVIVTLTTDENNAAISVSDTGIGIDLAEQKQIFNRFYRVNSDRSRQTGGTGLGLAIAQAIVQVHNGTIQVQSVLGRGSTLTVKFPLAKNLRGKDQALKSGALANVQNLARSDRSKLPPECSG